MNQHQSTQDAGDGLSAFSETARPSRGMRAAYAVLAVGTIVFTLLYVVQLVRQNYLEPQFGPRFSVNLEQPEVASNGDPALDGADHTALRIAIAPVISPEKSIEIYRELAHYLAARVDREAEVLQRTTYAEINELVRYRRCDIALVCTYPFVRGEQDFGMEALVVPRVKGALTYHSLIVVPTSSEARSLLDLRGKRFACADMLSSSGWLFPAIWLESQGEDPESFFADILVAGSHDQSIQAVFSDYVDGAAVHSVVYERMAEENPAILTRTKVIQKSSPYGMPPFAVHPQIPADLKSRLREALLGMHEDPEGRRVLSSLDIDRFVVADPAIYDSVRRAVDRWESR